MNRPRVLFMGTPEFAIPTLHAISRTSCEIVLVVTQPDKPTGRGRKLKPPPIKTAAIQLGLPVFQPATLKPPEVWQQISSSRPDLCLVAAYGKILKTRYLDLPTLGCINVHASLLPRWRGAAPINWAIMAGDRQTGVTLMQMNQGLDTGDILSTWSTEVGLSETAGELHDRLANAGALLVEKLLQDILQSRSLEPTPQNDAEATYAPMLTREHGLVDFARPARLVAAHINGLAPKPGATCLTPRGTLRLTRARDIDSSLEAEPGLVLSADPVKGLTISTKQGMLEILECQRPGKRALPAGELLRGLAEDIVGERWTTPHAS